MNDAPQLFFFTHAAADPGLKALATFCASGLLFLMLSGLLALCITHRHRLTRARVTRLLLTALIALAAARILNGLVLSERPYLLHGYDPLMQVSANNGFPSDHALAAMMTVLGALMIAPRWTGAFLVGTLLVMCGRLAVGAHHSLDVLGSVGTVLVAAVVASVPPLPESWRSPRVRSAKRAAA